MPLTVFSKRLFKDRVDFAASLTEKEVIELVRDKDLKVLQCADPVDNQTWEMLNKILFTKRPDIELRVYGFYSLVCDLAFTSIMTNVHHFSVNCRDVEGVEHISAMQNLESLGIEIYHLDRFDFLNQITPHLKKLSLGQTKSNKPDLTPLKRFGSIQEIYIEGQHKNIEVLSDLKSLQDVTLRSITTPDINYLSPLKSMWSLDIKLGGIRNINGIAGMNNIKYLELWQINGLSDINVISSLTGLQYLFLQSLRQVTGLPSFSQLTNFRRIYLENMKGLEDIRSLVNAPVLEEFIHADNRKFLPQDYIPILKNRTLKKTFVGFSSKKMSLQFNDLLREYKVEPFQGSREFNFF
jgi:hypothetical protein